MKSFALCKEDMVYKLRREEKNCQVLRICLSLILIVTSLHASIALQNGHELPEGAMHIAF